MLLGGAFLAGLLTVAVVLLLPGGYQETSPPPESPPRPERKPPARGGDEAKSPAAGNADTNIRDAMLPPGETGAPRLAVVVDDLGYEPGADGEWLKVPGPLTFAIIPFGVSSRKIAEAARARGVGLLIHVPMEPERPATDRTDAFRLRRNMTAGEMGALFARMRDENPWATGASNHMGSAFTADAGAMETYARLLAEKGFYLVDSATTPRSVALEAARKAGIRAVRRDVFLDAFASPGDLQSRWDKAVAIAREKGIAVVLCHGGSGTRRFVAAALPGLAARGVRPVTVDEIVGARGR